MIRSWDFNSKDFGRCIDWLRLAAQSLFRISGHPEVFTAIIIIVIRRRWWQQGWVEKKRKKLTSIKILQESEKQ